MAHETVTLFTWGYWGWGTAARTFVDAADALERSRGHAPPVFVDIRLRRGVRAPQFTGNAFERIVGADRHHWMKALGNRSVAEHAPGIRIDKPAAAEDLLDLALDRERERQHIIFFCACEFPGHEDRDGCHRTAVARLVLEAASRRGRPARIEEWPGGEPAHDAVFEVPSEVLHKLDRGAKSVTLGNFASPASVAGLPWGSVVECRTPDGASSRTVLVGSPRYSAQTGWYLQRIDTDAAMGRRDDLVRRARELRSQRGFEARDAVNDRRP